MTQSLIPSSTALDDVILPITSLLSNVIPVTWYIVDESPFNILPSTITSPIGIAVCGVESTNSPPLIPASASYLCAISATVQPFSSLNSGTVPTNNLEGSLTTISLPLYVPAFTSTT